MTYEIWRCPDCFSRQDASLKECCLCNPSESEAVCEKCGDTFVDDLYMIQHMMLGTHGVRCHVCFSRISLDDCREQDKLDRQAEERRLDRIAFENNIRKIGYWKDPEGGLNTWT